MPITPCKFDTPTPSFEICLETRQTFASALEGKLLRPNDSKGAYSYQWSLRSASAVVLGLVYGHSVAEEGDLYVDLANQTTRSLGKCGLYGTYYVVS